LSFPLGTKSSNLIRIQWSIYHSRVNGVKAEFNVTFYPNEIRETDSECRYVASIQNNFDVRRFTSLGSTNEESKEA